VIAAASATAQPAGRSIRMIYAYQAGGSGDAMARILADRLQARIGNSVIVENRAGASGRIGTKAVIAAEADGTTLLFSPLGPMSLHPVVYANLDFDPFTELAPISQIATFDNAMMVATNVPVKNLDELISWLRANPEKASYGTPGFGGLPHFFAVMFATSAKVTLRNVPYRGGAAALNDLVAGQLPIAILTSSDAAAVAKAGKARVLATSGRARSPLFDDVPTFREAGYAIEGEGWYALYAPAKTPSDVILRLSTEVRAVLQEPATRERVTALGLVPTGTTPEDLRRIQRADQEMWAPAIRASGFKPTD
jgi:tripartite-type tricarboxylate transporter receptor subunit TctC